MSVVGSSHSVTASRRQLSQGESDCKLAIRDKLMIAFAMQSPASTRERARRLRKATNLPEGVLWRALKRNQLEGLHFRRQHPIGPYVLDFYCHAARLCVEVDGQMHHFGNRPERDKARDAWLAQRGIRTVRLSASYVLDEMDGALRTILDAVADRRANPVAIPVGELSRRSGD